MNKKVKLTIGIRLQIIMSRLNETYTKLESKNLIDYPMKSSIENNNVQLYSLF